MTYGPTRGVFTFGVSRSVQASGFGLASFESWKRPTDGGIAPCLPLASTAECDRYGPCSGGGTPNPEPNAGTITVTGIGGTAVFTQRPGGGYDLPTNPTWPWAEGATLTGTAAGGPDVGALVLSAAVPRVVRLVDPQPTNGAYTLHTTTPLMIAFDAVSDAPVYMRLFAVDSAATTTWVYCRFAPGSSTYVVPTSMLHGLSGMGGFVFLTANEATLAQGDWDVTFQVESRIPRADGGSFPDFFTIN